MTNLWAKIYQIWCVCPNMDIWFLVNYSAKFCPIWIKIHIRFPETLATRRRPMTSVFGMLLLRWFGIIGPKIDQIWAWLHRRHRWAVGVRVPGPPQKFGQGLLINCYLENKFHKKWGSPRIKIMGRGRQHTLGWRSNMKAFSILLEPTNALRMFSKGGRTFSSSCWQTILIASNIEWS